MLVPLPATYDSHELVLRRFCKSHAPALVMPVAVRGAQDQQFRFQTPHLYRLNATSAELEGTGLRLKQDEDKIIPDLCMGSNRWLALPPESFENRLNSRCRRT